MKYLIYAGLIVFMALGTQRAHAETDSYYITIGAVLGSQFAFATDDGKLNGGETSEGSGNYMGLGYVLNDFVSFELGYTDSNNYEDSSGPTSEANTLEASVFYHYQWKQDARLLPYLRWGYYATQIKQTFPDDDGKLVTIDDHSSDNFLYGVGLDWKLRSNAALRFDYTPGSIDDDEFNRAMIALVVNFD